MKISWIVSSLIVAFLAGFPAEADSFSIRESIVNQLEKANELGRHEIDIIVRQGKVSLEGVVASDADSALIEQIARNTAGVSSVSNGLAVQSEWAKSNNELARRIRRAIESNHEIQGYNLDIQSMRGEIILNGSAKSDRVRELIESTARAEAGDTKVISKLQAGQALSDAELATRVRQTLSQSGGVNVDDLNVMASNGVVTLSGQRSNHRDIDRILSITLMVEGVKDVHSEMKLVR